MCPVSCLLYRYLIFPLVFVLAHVAALFSKNIRKGLKGRYRAVAQLKNWHPSEKEVVYFHAASLGEFEHIRPLIYHLGKQYRVVVTFFSPSGFEHAKPQFNDEQHFYLPFDFYHTWLKIFQRLKPKIIVISKHDIWANQILAAKKLGIPIYLVNGSLPANSTRLNPLYRIFYRSAYQNLTQIFSISREDKKRFEKIFGLKNVKLIGDTKFDQVLLRKKMAAKKEYIPRDWVEKHFIFVFGSLWPEDYQVLAEPLKKIMQEFSQVKTLFVPHQLHEHFIQHIRQDFNTFGIKRFNEESPFAAQRILIVDVVGILADLYKYAQVAYIGGSFKQGIHNVMEAAVYGIPVMYGPKHENSFEAKQLAEEGGSFVIRESSDFYTLARRLISDESFRKLYGNKVKDFVQKKTGATERILNEWRDIVKIKPSEE